MIEYLLIKFQGGDLDQRFKKNKKEGIKLSEEQVLDWTVQLLSAVNYMHSRRVLHRDLKARLVRFRQSKSLNSYSILNSFKN